MAEPTVVQSIADDRIVAAEDRIATAQTSLAATQASSLSAQSTVAAAQSTIATAQSTIAAAQTTTSSAQVQMATAQTAAATAVTKLANLDAVPFPDYSVWLTVLSARCQLANATASSIPEAAAYADRALAEFKRRFPRADAQAPAPTPTPPAPTPAPGAGISSGADYLPELSVSLFQPVTPKA